MNLKKCLLIFCSLALMISHTVAMKKSSTYISSNSSAINQMIPWSEYQEIQNLIHNQPENAKFEIKTEPICIEKLAKIISSFINGTESPSYIIIGIAEVEDYIYKTMSKDSFDKLPTKENGIYGIFIDDENKLITKFYQVINNKESELTLSAGKKEGDIKKVMNKNGAISLVELKRLFSNDIMTNPINTNNISPIKLPIKVATYENTKDKKNDKFPTYLDKESYISALESYMKSETIPEINFEKHVKVIYTAPYNQESTIIILEISPHKSSLIQNKRDKKYYERSPIPRQDDFGTYPMDGDSIYEKLLKRYYDQINGTPPMYDNNKVAVPELKNLFDYIYLGKIDEFKILIEQMPNLALMSDSAGNNALIIAAYYGKEEFIDFLLTNGSSYNINDCHINNECENVLLAAIRMDRYNVVDKLFKEYPDLIKKIDGNLDKVFLKACQHYSGDVIQNTILCRKPTNSNVKNLIRGLNILKKENKLGTNKEIKNVDIKEIIENFLFENCNDYYQQAITAAKIDNLDRMKKILQISHQQNLMQHYNSSNKIFLEACKYYSRDIIKYFLDINQARGNILTKNDLEKGMDEIEKQKRKFDENKENFYLPEKYEEIRKLIIEVLDEVYSKEPYSQTIIINGGQHLTCPNYCSLEFIFNMLSSDVIIKSLEISVNKDNFNYYDKRSINIVKEISQLYDLENLYLYNLYVGDEGAKILANSKLINLKKLKLINSGTGNAGLKALTNSNLTNLTSLNLQYNPIDLYGGLAIVKGNLENLTYLNLCHNKIKNNGISDLYDDLYRRYGDNITVKKCVEL